MRTLLICGPMPLLILAACHEEKPVITADPDFANCEAKKNITENECLIEAGTRAQFDACIAAKRKSCVDGGT